MSAVNRELLDALLAARKALGITDTFVPLGAATEVHGVIEQALASARSAAPKYIAVMIHGGTDWAVFRAAHDEHFSCLMTLEAAREAAQANARHMRCNWFDQSDEVYDEGQHNAEEWDRDNPGAQEVQS